MSESAATTNPLMSKVRRYFQDGTLVEKSKSFLTRTVLGAPERLRLKHNGGVFEVPDIGRSYFAKGAETYLEKRAQHEDWRLEQLAVASLLERIPDGSSVLDVPFGTGRFVDLYLDKRMDVFGIEQSSDMLEAARKTLGAKFDSCNAQTGDALKLPFIDNTFDLVVSFRFLPHILSYDQTIVALKEFHRVTSRFAILQIGGRENETYRRRLPKGYEKMESWLYPSEVEDLLENIGFEILERTQPLHSATTTTMRYTKNIGDWRGYFCYKIP